MRLSLSNIANRAGGTVSRVCGICHRTFSLPVDNLVLVRPAGRAVEWHVDIGAYCTRCEDYRCERHIGTRDGIDKEPDAPDLPIVELFCTQCGERVVFRS